MSTELIELLKIVSGDTATLIGWYLVVDLLKTIVSWVGAIGCAVALGFGHAKCNAWLNGRL